MSTLHKLAGAPQNNLMIARQAAIMYEAAFDTFLCLRRNALHSNVKATIYKNKDKKPSIYDKDITNIPAKINHPFNVKGIILRSTNM